MYHAKVLHQLIIRMQDLKENNITDYFSYFSYGLSVIELVAIS